MRASQMNVVTLRADPADAEIASHRLLIRAGFIYKSGSGLYLYGPLMQRVLDKVRRIVAEEITAAGGLEITMPILQEQELWESSGRWDAYMKTRTMLTTTDRGGTTFGLAPTAEEVVTDYVKHIVSSYKQLPVCYFQQHTKFRDEIRPRFGLMRVKEFIMMDAYSFHADTASLDATYRAMHDAYHRIFRRCGLEAFAVEADTGAIGGSDSHEFMIGAAVGEDAILFDEANGYAANIERARSVISAVDPLPADTVRVVVPTPDVGSIEDVVAFLQTHGHPAVAAHHLAKILLVVAETADAEVRVAAVVRGDRTVNEVKLTNAVSRILGEAGPVLALRPMTPDEVHAASGAAVGFAGPVTGLTVDHLIIDERLDVHGRWVTGANRTDHHVVGCSLEEVPSSRADLTLAAAGDVSPAGGVLVEKRGIEAGHIFKLGTKYSAAMDCVYQDAVGTLQPMTMGCYGIGSSRIVAAAVEQHHDEQGMKWPLTIAPYHCVIVVTKQKDAPIAAAGERLHDELIRSGVETVLDDRDLGAGVKFKDWELIGIPMRLVVGRGVADGEVEFQVRGEERQTLPLEGAATTVAALVRAGLQGDGDV